MKILVLDEEFPFPLDSGKRIRSYALYRRLARQMSVDYLAFGDATSNAAAALRDVGIHPVAAAARLPGKSGLAFYGRLLANLLSPLPYSVSSHHQAAFAAAVRSRLAQEDYDAVICEWTPYAQYVLDQPAPPRIVATHNMEHQIWERLRDAEPPGPKKAYIALQARKWLAFERRVFNGVEAAIAVSEHDARAIGAFNPDLPTVVVDNGVDLETFKPGPEDAEQGDVVFVGSMDWRPNQDAVRWFIGEIWPRIRQRCPRSRFVVVGRRPPEAIRRLSGEPGVMITGTVDDVVPYIEQAAVCVVPLRIGGGSRLKILEALAMAKAVVSTRIGAEGLELRDQEHVYLEDHPEGFARSTIAMIDHPDLRRRIGRAGRTVAVDRYGWDGLARRFGRFIARCAGNGMGTANWSYGP